MLNPEDQKALDRLLKRWLDEDLPEDLCKALLDSIEGFLTEDQVEYLYTQIKVNFA